MTRQALQRAAAVTRGARWLHRMVRRYGRISQGGSLECLRVVAARECLEVFRVWETQRGKARGKRSKMGKRQTPTTNASWRGARATHTIVDGRVVWSLEKQFGSGGL